MKTVNSCFVLVALLGLVPLDLAEVITTWHPCPPDPETTIACTVHEVRVQPCRQAALRKPCNVRRGNSASISFDFTPDFSGGNLTTGAYWMNQEFPGMNTDGCNVTTCPVTAGTRQSYTYTLYLTRFLPKNAYEVQWKLRNTENKGCCFQFSLKLL